MSDSQRTIGRVSDDSVPFRFDEQNSDLSQKRNIHSEKDKEVVFRNAGIVSEKAIALEDEERQVIDFFQQEHRTKTGIWSRVFWYFVILVLAWLIYETTISLIQVWTFGPWVAGPITFLTVGFILLFCIAIFREKQAYSRVDKLNFDRKDIQRFTEEGRLSNIKDILSPTLLRLKRRFPEEVKTFESAAESRSTPEEYLSLFENTILVKLDVEAEKVIKKEALTVGAAVAIAPHPSLDFVIVVWRSLRLIRSTGQIYGLEPTGLSSLRIFRHMLTSAITAAGMEKIGSMAVEAIGIGVLETTGKNIVEGAVLSTRIYRLGKMVQQSVRPIDSQKNNL